MFSYESIYCSSGLAALLNWGKRTRGSPDVPSYDRYSGTCFPIKTLEVKCSRRIYIESRLCAASTGAVINWVARGQRPQPPQRGKTGEVSLSSRRHFGLCRNRSATAKHPDDSANKTRTFVNVYSSPPQFVHLKGINLEVLKRALILAEAFPFVAGPNLGCRATGRRPRAARGVRRAVGSGTMRPYRSALAVYGTQASVPS
ncbi:unnamed protein product [Pieris brassicae]|uniref:Uncharacterized protein n=1 Tax=Pieris brassicae TaxID=7116 RepID=A0A9P0XHF5_PIEBR|nr:unnamed protein product [Pieris brassicae]